MFTITADQKLPNLQQTTQVVLGPPSVKGFVRFKGNIGFAGRTKAKVKRYNHFTIDQVSLTVDNEFVFTDQTIFYDFEPENPGQ